jgi:hypothetical protein
MIETDISNTAAVLLSGVAGSHTTLPYIVFMTSLCAVCQDGRRIEVVAHFGGTDREPATPEAQFLRAVARRLYGEAVFSVVLTPFWDALHRDHFHLDMARYRVDGAK